MGRRELAAVSRLFFEKDAAMAQMRAVEGHQRSGREAIITG